MSDKPVELSVAYVNRAERPIITASDAIVGRSPDGTLLTVHFFLEHASIPSLVTLPVDDDGRVHPAQEVRSVTQGDMTRNVTGTLVVTPAMALRFGALLVQNAKAALGQRGEE